MDLFFFSLFAFIAVVCAINVVLQTHPISSALSLIGVMGSLAVLYLLLGAEFIAMAQIIVYAGAVMVLFIFVIMLLNAGVEERRGRSWMAQIARHPRCCVALLGAALLSSSSAGSRTPASSSSATSPAAARAERRLRALHRLPAALRSHFRSDSDRHSRRDRPCPKGTGLMPDALQTAEQRRAALLVSHAERRPVCDRRRRFHVPAQHHHRVHVHRADAERGESELCHFRVSAQAGQRPHLRVLRDGGGGGRSSGGPRHHPDGVQEPLHSEHRRNRTH